MTINIVAPVHHRTFLQFLCVTLLAISLPNYAEAQDWKFEPKIRVGGEYDDNADLAYRTDEEVESTGFLLDLRADVFYTSPATLFSLQPKVVSRNYTDESRLDSDDLYLRSRLNHRAQKNTIGYRLNYDEQSVRTAEQSNVDFEIDDPEDITDDSTGRVLLSGTGTRKRLRITPYWNYQLSTISSVGAQINYFDVNYDDVVPGTLTDYSDTRLKLNYRRGFSNVNTGLLTATARTYDAKDGSGDITGYGIVAGFDYALSEKMRVEALIGFEDTEQSGFDYDPEVVGSVRVIRTLETIRLLAEYRRSAAASGSSRIAIRDSLNLNFERRLNERVGAAIGVRAFHSENAGESASPEERNYVQLQSRFSWYASTSFVIEAEYSYTINDFSNVQGISGLIDERANSNRVVLWFTYQPKTIPKL